MGTHPRDAKKLLFLEIAKRHGAGGGYRPAMAVAGYLPSGLREKRPSRALAGWNEKLFVPVPMEVKLLVMRLARENGMSQAEFTWCLLIHTLGTAAVVRLAVRQYRKVGGARGPSPALPPHLAKARSEVAKARSDWKRAGRGGKKKRRS